MDLLSEKDSTIRDRIKYTIGLVCGHQKSSKFAEYLAWQVGIFPGNLQFIDFRKKNHNKTADDYDVEFKGIIGGITQNIVKPMKDLKGQNWGQGYFKTTSSDYTDDVMNETADITIGDAWLPEYINDSYGNNIIIVRNHVLHEIITSAASKKKLNLTIVDKDKIFASQSAHFRHTHDELAYRLYLKDKKRDVANNDLADLPRSISG